MFETVEQVKSYCEKNNIKMIDFKMIDLLGRWRHLTIPVERFSDETIKYGVGFDGSNYGYANVEKSDMVFIPDLTSAFMEPFVEVPTLSMIGDVYVTGETPERFSQDPRAIAYKAEKYMISTGIADEMRTGPEFEFFVFDHISFEIKPNSISLKIDAEQAGWNSAKQEHNIGFKVPLKSGYHISPPTDVLFDLRSKICMLLEERGIKVKYHHHEVGGAGQLEIEVEPGPMSKMADNTMLIKYIVKNAAYSIGKSATFLPKPIYGEAGNGMHVHIHLFKQGKPVFYDPKGYSGLSDEALYFIGGLLTHAPALCAIINPSTNSYKRLVPGYEAPVSVCYATSNRSAVIRIPDYAKAPHQKRFEIRNPDATCNPYYAYSAILMAGLDGIKNKIDPQKAGFGPYDINLYNLSKEEQAKIKPLPTSLSQALTALENDHQFLLEGGVFTKALLDTWIERKRHDTAEFNKIPHPAEYLMYYDL